MHQQPAEVVVVRKKFGSTVMPLVSVLASMRAIQAATPSGYELAFWEMGRTLERWPD